MNRLLASALALGCLCGTPAMAETASTKYPFKIYALGIPIGKASITLARTADSYHMTFYGKFGGLVAIFTGAKGTMDISGTYDTVHGARPNDITTDIQWSQKLRHTVAHFKDGKVTDFEVTPAYTYEPEKRIPLDRDDLHDVYDPMSSMVRPLKDGKMDCTPRLRVFDGRERYDLVFSPTKDPWTCHVQPIPMSGYDHRKKSPQHPSEPLDITFAPIEDGSLALPTKFVRDMLLGSVQVARIAPSDDKDDSSPEVTDTIPFKPATNN